MKQFRKPYLQKVGDFLGKGLAYDLFSSFRNLRLFHFVLELLNLYEEPVVKFYSDSNLLPAPYNAIGQIILEDNSVYRTGILISSNYVVSVAELPPNNKATFLFRGQVHKLAMIGSEEARYEPIKMFKIDPAVEVKEIDFDSLAHEFFGRDRVKLIFGKSHLDLEIFSVDPYAENEQGVVTVKYTTSIRNSLNQRILPMRLKTYYNHHRGAPVFFKSGSHNYMFGLLDINKEGKLVCVRSFDAFMSYLVGRKVFPVNELYGSYLSTLMLYTEKNWDNRMLEYFFSNFSSLEAQNLGLSLFQVEKDKPLTLCDDVHFYLNHLSLSSSSLNANLVEQLKNIAKKSVLNYFYFNNNTLPDQEASLIVSHLKQLDYSKLYELKINANSGLDPMLLTKFLIDISLFKAQNLTYISLLKCQLNDQCVELLAPSLSNIKSLKTLLLGNNEIEDKGALAVSLLTVGETIDLSNNPITISGEKSVAKNLKTSVKVLFSGKCLFGERAGNEVKESEKKERNEKVSCGGCSLI